MDQGSDNGKALQPDGGSPVGSIMPRRTSSSARSNSWVVLGIIVGLQVVTEVGPWLLGFGDKVIFDWSF